MHKNYIFGLNYNNKKINFTIKFCNVTSTIFFHDKKKYNVTSAKFHRNTFGFCFYQLKYNASFFFLTLNMNLI